MTRFWAPSFPFRPERFPLFYGWVVVVGATFGILFSIPGQTMGFSVFTDTLIRELGLTRVQLSTAYFIGTVGSGFALPFLGRLFDTLGSRRMVTCSALVTALVLFYLAATASLSQRIALLLPAVPHPVIPFSLITLGFFLIRASAQGVLTMSCRNAMAKWFHARRGQAAAISQVLVSLGFGAAPLFLESLIQSLTYAGAWNFLGAFTLLFMVPFAWLVFRDNPEESGLKMDGFLPVPSSTLIPDMQIHRDFTRSEALRSYAFWAFNLSLAFYAFYSTAYTFHIEAIGKEFGLPKETIIAYFGPTALVAVVANLSSGFLSSRVRAKFLLAAMNLGALLGAIGMLNLDASWGVIAYIAGNGVSGGCFVNLAAIIWPRFFGRTHLGAISGVAMSTMVIASALGPVAFAQIEAWTGAYRPALQLSAAIPTALILASFAADNPQRKLAETR